MPTPFVSSLRQKKQPVKTCKECGEVKIATAEFFYSQKARGGRLQAKCKKCTRICLNKYKQENKEAIKQYSAARYIKNKDKIAKNGKEYRQKNKTAIANRAKEYYQKNKDVIINHQKEYYQKNKEVIGARGLEYRRENVKGISDRGKKYRDGIKKYTTATANKLFADFTRVGPDGNLQTKCKNSSCGKWFNPAASAVASRIKAINGIYKTHGAEAHFYCSSQCKESCILYKAQPETLINLDRIQVGVNLDHSDYYSPEYLKTWSIQVKTNANNTCEICGATENLQAHHIKPKTIAPEIALDPANGVCLCGNCHYEHGHGDRGCRTSELRKCEVISI